GSTVRPPLPVVTLTFNEPVQSARVVVRAPSGGDAATGPAERDPSSPQVVRVPVAASEPGAYTVEYSVLSVDGHPVRGQLSFTLVGGASAEPPSGQPSGVSADSPTGSPGSPARPGAGAIWYGAGAVAVVAAVAALRRSRH
ncbi:MAG: copper resistance protein CopC, partial [Clostridia bacterium]|nr:copper resistance protein CopC [Clostridia bacterium]